MFIEYLFHAIALIKPLKVHNLDGFAFEVDTLLTFMSQWTTCKVIICRPQFVSLSNVVLLHFHSDYSVSGSGFSLSWRSVNLLGCPEQTLTAKEGHLMSPNYPHFLLSGLECATTVLAPGKIDSSLVP